MKRQLWRVVKLESMRTVDLINIWYLLPEIINDYTEALKR